MIDAFCPQCDKTYRVKDELAGKRARCPRGHVMAIPAKAAAKTPETSGSQRKQSSRWLLVLAGVGIVGIVFVVGAAALGYLVFSKSKTGPDLAAIEKAKAEEEAMKAAAASAARKEDDRWRAEKFAAEQERLVHLAKQKAAEAARLKALMEEEEKAKLKAAEEAAAKLKAAEEAALAKRKAAEAEAAREKAAWAPTKEQLEAAQRQFDKLGAGYTRLVTPWRDWFIPPYYPREQDAPPEDIVHQFQWFQEKLRLADAPDLPFRFGFSFAQQQPLRDADLAHLKRMKNLTYLSLDTSLITDDGFKTLTELPNLTTLSITNISPAGVKNLKDCPKLTRLHLRGPRAKSAKAVDANFVRNERGAAIKELKAIKTLREVGFDMALGRFVQLDELEGLRGLDITALNLPIETGKANLACKELRQHKNLSILTIGNSVTEEGLRELRDHKHLTALRFNPGGMLPEGYLELKRHENLMILDIAGGVFVTEEVMRNSLCHLRNLKVLDLYLTLVKDNDLKHLWMLQRLEYLNLAETKVTADAAKKLQKDLPKCKIVGVKGL